MKIEVAIEKGQSQNCKGELLEKLTKELLIIQNYHVENRVRFTGMEIDLLCKYKPNDKKIYVECKAYNEKNPIQSRAINDIIAKKSIRKECSEFWLVTTGPLGKDAKGLVEDIESQDDSKCYAFYTAEKFIGALVDGSKIKAESVINHLIIEDVGFDVSKISKESIFLITKYGNFWVKKILEGGEDNGVVFFIAESGDIVKDHSLLNNLKKIETTFKRLNYKIILSANPNLSLENLTLNENYLIKINDMGFKINHPMKDNLSLDDVFVSPDLEQLGDDNDLNKIISADKLFKESKEFNKNFIFGEDLSGKTSLAYFLQKKFVSNNFIPIYIGAESIKNSNEKDFIKSLSRGFKKQYGDGQFYVAFFDDVLEKNIEKIVLIIDNYDSIGIKNKKMQIEFLQMVNKKFQRIIIFINKKSRLEIFSNRDFAESLNDVRFFEIREMGYLLRDDLMTKWLTIEGADRIEEDYLFAQKDLLSDKIKTVVGTNFVPTYPIYILNIIQLADQRFSVKGSSYAGIYDFLIGGAFQSVEIDNDDLDFFYTYLSSLAYYLFKNTKKIISYKELIDFYHDYCCDMDIDKDFESIHSILIDSKIVNNINNEYCFNHNYTYYFFVAKYLSDNLSKEEVKEDIKKINSRLYNNDYANIIIFLIHHSKDNNVINNVLEEAEKMFEDVLPNFLSNEEMKSINSLIEQELRFFIKEEDPSQYRKEELKEKDSFNEKKSDSQKGEDDNKDLFSQVNLALKLVEIEGQILKNYYGSLGGVLKNEILTSTYNLGLKTLNVLLNSVDDFRDVLIDQIKEREKECGKEIPQQEKDRIIDKIIFHFNLYIATFFIDRISDSVSSKNLLNSVGKMENREMSPASELINICVKLNFPDGLIKEEIIDTYNSLKNNHLTQTLLKIIVMRHFYKFNVNFALKQGICDKLNINIKGGGGFLDSKLKKFN